MKKAPMYKHKRYGGIRRILSPLYFGYEKAPTEFFSISAYLLSYSILSYTSCAFLPKSL